MKASILPETGEPTVPAARVSISPHVDTPAARIILESASAEDRQQIYRIRHAVYAAELGQHPENSAARLTDDLDLNNVYLVAKAAGKIAGFISITPPACGKYSIEKYFTESQLPFSLHDQLFEVRLLTVLKETRNRGVSELLAYAALRWIQAHGGTQIVGLGRRELKEMYQRFGMQFTAGLTTKSGAVTYDPMHADVQELSKRCERFDKLLARFEEKTDWRLGFALRQPATCFHGGAFFDAIGETFATLERSETVINADVLDAWFPPAPGVIESLRERLPWLLRTSPPTGCEGLIRTIAEHRGVKDVNLLPGAGSSDLIFRALTCWLDKSSRVLLLDPTYGEYGHILKNVIGCQVEHFQLARERGYEVDLAALENSLASGYDLVVLVNPNSPTGKHVRRDRLLAVLRRTPTRTRIWVDETYVDYMGKEQSLERAAAESENLVVCKSMSKVYALSGARVAYLCAGAHQLETLRAVTPPWVVGLPAQVAAVRALEDPLYYSERYAETHSLRNSLAADLGDLGWSVVPGVANFLLCHLPPTGPRAGELVSQCRQHGLFLRDTHSMGATAADDEVRIAVKNATDNRRMIAILKSVLGFPASTN